MPTHCIHEEKETFYFTTFTCHRWLPLLERAEIHAYLPGWIDQLSSRGLIICGYVMMPNHLHLLLYVTADCKGLNQVLGDGKRFMAYEVVSKLKKLKEVPNTGPKSVNNALFVGSTTELTKLLKEKK